jgi:hypothetical protein
VWWFWAGVGRVLGRHQARIEHQHLFAIRGARLGNRGQTALSVRAGLASGRVAALDHAGLLQEGGGLSSKKLAGLKGSASILPFAPTWKTRPVCEQIICQLVEVRRS